MPNIDEVITGLECCTKSANPNCFSCPYNIHCQEGDTWVIKSEALELLKERQAIAPDIAHLEFTTRGSRFTVLCGKCKGEMIKVEPCTDLEFMKTQYRFCHHCGQGVLWNEGL